MRTRYRVHATESLVVVEHYRKVKVTDFDDRLSIDDGFSNKTSLSKERRHR